MHNIFFAGIKHSGKTTFARLLAEKLNLPFVDSDDLILKSIASVSVREFYKQNGEKAFKKVEAESVKNYVSSITRTFVMSLGGGASDNDELIEIVKGNGRLIYLVRPEEEMLAVILKHGVPAFLDEKDLKGSFHALYSRRDKIYREKADLIIDLGSYRDKGETFLFLLEKMGDLLNER